MELILHNSGPILAVVAPFLTVFVTHYTATNLYAYLCANMSVYGFFLSMLTTSSPICNVLLSIITHTQSSYAAIVSGIVVYIIQRLTFPQIGTT